MSINNSRQISDVKVLLKTGIDGSSIESIEKTGTVGLVDTYTITLTNGLKTTFTVTNGNGIVDVEKTGTAGKVDIYTITFDNGETTTFTVTNGADTNAQIAEKVTNPATKAYAVGEYVVFNDSLCEVTVAIPNGGTFAINTNLKATTVMGELSDRDASIIANTQLIDETVGWTGANLNGTKYESRTASNVVFTVQTDGGVAIGAGTAGSSNAQTPDDANLSSASFVAKYTGQVTVVGGYNANIHVVPYDYTDGARPYKDSAMSTRLGSSDNAYPNHDVSFYMIAGHKYSMNIRVVHDTVIPSGVVVYVMLCKQELLDKSYEPYHTSVINILRNAEVVGKNLLNPNIISNADLQYIPVYVGNGEYTLSSDVPRTSGNSAVLFFFGGIVSDGASTTTNGVWNEQPRTVNAIDGYVTVASRNIQSVDPTQYNTQLEQGAVATNFVPYGKSLKELAYRRDEQAVMGAVNLAESHLNASSESGVSYVRNADETITCSNQATANGGLKITNNFILKAGESYKIVGCPANGSDTTYKLVLRKSDNTSLGEDKGNGLVYTPSTDTECYLQVRYQSGYTANETFKPMVTLDLNATYDDYVPYAMTNKELTDEIATKQKKLDYSTSEQKTGLTFAGRDVYKKTYVVDSGSFNTTATMNVAFDGTWGDIVSLNAMAMGYKSSDISTNNPFMWRPLGYYSETDYLTVECAKRSGDPSNTFIFHFKNGSDTYRVKLIVDIYYTKDRNS